jgi:hypothetical protein
MVDTPGATVDTPQGQADTHNKPVDTPRKRSTPREQSTHMTSRSTHREQSTHMTSRSTHRELSTRVAENADTRSGTVNTRLAGRHARYRRHADRMRDTLTKPSTRPTEQSTRAAPRRHAEQPAATKPPNT